MVNSRKLRPVLAAGLVSLAAMDSAAGAGEPLVIEGELPLKGVSGRIDHMAIDLARRRLMIAELGNNTVGVVDLTTGQMLHRIAGLAEPQGVGFLAASDLLMVANARDGSVAFFRGEDYSPLGQIDLGDDADNVRVDPASGRAVVGYGAGALAIIDPASRSKLADVKLTAHPEGFQLTRDGRRAYVNVPDAGHIAVADLGAGRQVAAWPVPGLRANFPAALDDAQTTLAVVFRSPPRLVLLDTANGAVRAQLETCGDADDVFFDARRRRIYVTCGAGAVDVFEHQDGNTRRLARIATVSGARTALFVPELDRLYVAARAGRLWGDAKILVLRPEP